MVERSLLFHRWRQYAHKKRNARTRFHLAFVEWRHLSRTTANEKRALVEHILALRVLVLGRVIRAWKEETQRRIQVDGAIERFEKIRSARLLKQTFQAWFRVTREELKSRWREEEKSVELERLSQKLDFMRLAAERDVALEKARMTENTYLAIEFRERKERERRERVGIEAFEPVDSGESEEALKRAQWQKQALVRILKELRLQAVADLDFIDYRDRQRRFSSEEAIGRKKYSRLA